MGKQRDPMADKTLDEMLDRRASLQRLSDACALDEEFAVLHAVVGYSCDRLSFEISAYVAGGSSRL